MTESRRRRKLLKLGLSLFVAPATARAQQCRVTPRDALGPFYKPGAPAQEELCASSSGGERKLIVSGRVLGMPDCAPVADALVEVWQADERGHYSQVGAKRDEAGCLLRASIKTDRAGRYRYATVLPGDYPGRPPHIHYRVSRTGYATLVTQVYFDRHRGVPDSLVVSVAPGEKGFAQARFDITLASAGR
ncbi:MAG TPA: hypothetical protein VJ834_09350 [Burkholderiales bacterium]|nr:hypothetical protein [Burkholderiales bacterium]